MEQMVTPQLLDLLSINLLANIVPNIYTETIENAATIKVDFNLIFAISLLKFDNLSFNTANFFSADFYYF